VEKNCKSDQKNIEHIPCNEAAEKLKPRQKTETGPLQNPTVIFVDF
jgi:hypothetical protein